MTSRNDWYEEIYYTENKGSYTLLRPYTVMLLLILTCIVAGGGLINSFVGSPPPQQQVLLLSLIAVSPSLAREVCSSQPQLCGPLGVLSIVFGWYVVNNGSGQHRIIIGGFLLGMGFPFIYRSSLLWIKEFASPVASLAASAILSGCIYLSVVLVECVNLLVNRSLATRV